MINQVVLVGRLTKDADLRYTSGGQAVSTFNLAVNRNFTNQSGEREADFVNCVIWRKPAETLANYAKKGTLIGVVGRIQTRNYENQQGQKVYVTEVVCDNFQLLESKKDNNQNNQQNNQSFQQESMPGMDKRGFNNDSDPFRNSSQIDISSQDLPF
ncbi:single-stranded DNA-binding protein [Vagococcus fluvialis]|uniref:single-stranded DNA-binding protein n=1 Tax=Vagococcus fluvialis TaxID=2738 RepID=UPI003BF033F5